MIELRTYALLLFFIVSLKAAGQDSSDFNVTHYTSDNGLPQNSVRQVVIDKKGFLWLGTQGGIVRFDGNHFKIYNRDNTPSLTSNRIRDIGLLSDSSVYFIDANSNLFSFDGQNSPIRVKFNEYNKALVILSQTGYYDLVNELKSESDRKLIKSFIQKIGTTDFVYSRVGALGNGFLKVADRYLFYMQDKKVIFSDTIAGSTGIIGSNLYYIDDQSKICKINTSGKKCGVKLKLTNETGSISIFKKDAFFSQQGDNLYLYSNNRIYCLKENTENEVLCEPMLATGNIVNIINYKHFPTLGIQVVSSTTKGLYIFRKKQFSAVGLDIPGFDGSFSSQAIYNKDAVLTSRGVISTSPSNTKDLSALYLQNSILKDYQNNFWIPQIRGGLVQLGPDLNVIKKIPNVSAVCIRQTADGTIWFSASNLMKVVGNGTQEFRMKENLNISTFLPVSNNEFWIGHSKGLLLYDVSSQKENHVASMDNKEVRALYFDKQKTLWAGTYGQGFYAIKNGKSIKFPLDKNGYLLFTHSFLEDKSGFLWMTTNHGLFKCKIQDLHDYIDKKVGSVYYHYYDKKSGFVTNEFNGGCTPSGVIFADGKFSFPSLDGLVQFYPDSIKDILPSSDILIDKFLVDGISQPFTTELNLEPSTGRIEFRLVSPYFGKAENQTLEYNLAGLNENWYELDDDNTISLDRLEHGNYMLQVRKKAGFGKDNVKIMVKPFRVKPFWYQRWHYRLLGFLVFVAAIFGLVMLWYLYLIKRKTLLEKQVQDRTAKLLYSNRLKEKMTLLIAHDLQSPLHFLKILSEHVFKSAQASNWEEVMSGSQEIKKATNNIHSFVEEFTLWSRSQNENFNLTKESFYIDELIKELQQFYQEMLVLNNNRVSFENLGPQIIHTNREILKAVLRNLLDNANKYTRHGKILFRLETDDNGKLILTISDNGSGMSLTDLNKINKRIAQASTIASIEQNSRLGYQIIIDFVIRLGCRLEVTSSKGNGTTVKIIGLSSGKTSYLSGKSLDSVSFRKLN